jgi:peroxiredoxin Q/BCP
LKNKIDVGEVAPDFLLPDETGTMRTLAEFRGRKNVVLYFYPKDFTSGCTAESCLFRDRYDRFMTQDTEVLGVSRDTVESHLAFKKELGLPFSLLADVDGTCHEHYGVSRAMAGLMAARVTLVIDKQSVIRHVHQSELRPTSHIEEALKALKN